MFHTRCSQASSVLHCSLAPTGCSLQKVDVLLLFTACCMMRARYIDPTHSCSFGVVCGDDTPALRTIPHVFAICKEVKQYSDGGDEGARTPDLDSAIVALSQLSYIPWY